MTSNFKEHHATPVTSIRAFCVQCMGYQPGEVRGCPTTNYVLYPYRMKHVPDKKLSKLIGLTEAIQIMKNGYEAKD